MQNIVVAVYSHPEAYPPTLNAIELLAGASDKVTIVCRNVFKTEWTYPANAVVKTSGKYISIRDSEKRALAGKVLSFLQFTRLLLRQIKKEKPVAVLICDAFPLLSYRLIMPFLKHKPLLWYHNHDVSQPGMSQKFSIGYFAEKNEPLMFNAINVFSLPSTDRKIFFPLDNFSGAFFFLPNYPSVYFYKRFYREKTSLDAVKTIKIIYQGSIGTGHGLEQIIPLLRHTVNGKDLHLVLKGFISDTYKSALVKLAAENDVTHKLVFIGVTPYQDVPKITADCHIGIGIHMAEDRMNATLGTASNKIYEYAALGLPVLVYDSRQFRKYLGNYQWAFFTDCSQPSLTSAIQNILQQYAVLSGQAHADFRHELNFEKYFIPVMNKVLSIKD